MPNLDALNPADRKDFEARLSRYGLTTSVLQARLEAKGKTSLGRAGGRHKPHVVPIQDVATLTKMFALPDSVFKEHPWQGAAAIAKWKPHTPALKRVLESDNAGSIDAYKDIDFKQIQVDDLKAIQTIALGFGRGAAVQVTKYAALVSAYLQGIQYSVAFWAFIDVYVGPQTVLEFDDSVHTLVAHQVTVDVGGQILSRGGLTIDCTIFKAM